MSKRCGYTTGSPLSSNELSEKRQTALSIIITTVAIIVLSWLFFFFLLRRPISECRKRRMESEKAKERGFQMRESVTTGEGRGKYPQRPTTTGGKKNKSDRLRGVDGPVFVTKQLRTNITSSLDKSCCGNGVALRRRCSPTLCSCVCVYVCIYVFPST